MSPFLLFGIAALGLGVIFGSFLNALLFRFNTGKGIGGRSRCMRCNHELGALDLVPILSYALLRGRCRYCGSRISAQYPLVEAAAALLALGVYLQTYPSALLFAYWFIVWLVVLFIFVYDLRHMIIPWSASLTLLGLALFGIALRGVLDPMPLVAGMALALPLFLLSLVSGGRWMGWADSLFELSLGILLGLSAGASGLLLAVWIGAAVGVGILLWQKYGRLFTPTGASHKHRAGFTIRSEIPFAPFLAIGAALAFFLHVDILSTLIF